MQDKLNTMDSFENEGFKIERDGQVITLTKEEMSDFRFFDKAIYGRVLLNCYEHETEAQKYEIAIIQKIKADALVCNAIAESIEDTACNTSFGDTLYAVGREVRRVEQSVDWSKYFNDRKE